MGEVAYGGCLQGAVQQRALQRVGHPVPTPPQRLKVAGLVVDLDVHVLFPWHAYSAAVHQVAAGVRS